MKNVAGVIGRKSDVAEAIRSIAPAHPILKLVSHSKEQAYTLVSVPDEIARAFECQSRVQGVKGTQRLAEPGSYGNYYGAILGLRVPGDPPRSEASLGHRERSVKDIAYSVEVP